MFEEGKISDSENYIHIAPLDKEKINIDGDFYLAQFDGKQEFNYIGLVSKNNVLRQHFGIERYVNKDIFVGQHLDDKRNGIGLYIFLNDKLNEEKVDDPKPDTISRFYYGGWAQNKKNGFGALLISKKFKDATSNSIFEGCFKDDQVEFGYSYEENSDKSFCCHYGFYHEGKLADNEALFYLFHDDESSVIVSHMDNGNMIDGIKFNFGNQGAFLNYIAFKMDKEQLNHEHLDQGEELNNMKDDIRVKWGMAEKFYKIVNDERAGLVNNYIGFVNKEEELKKTATFDDFYANHDGFTKEYTQVRLSKFGSKLFEEIKKQK